MTTKQNVTPIRSNNDGWTASLLNPPAVEKSNPLIGNYVGDTLNRIAAILAYYQHIDPALHEEEIDDPSEQAKFGRYLVLDLVLDTAQDALLRQYKQLEIARVSRGQHE